MHRTTRNMEKRKVSISLTQANVFSVALLAGGFLVFSIPFLLLWPEWYRHVPIGTSTVKDLLLLMVIMAGGVVAHEGLHGLTWAFSTKEDSVTSASEFCGNTPHLIATILNR